MQNTSSQEFQTPGQDSKPRKKNIFQWANFPVKLFMKEINFFHVLFWAGLPQKRFIFIYNNIDSFFI